MANWIDLLGGGASPADIAGAVQGSFDAKRSRDLQEAALRQKEQERQQEQAYRSRVSDMLRSGDIRGAAGQAFAFGDDKAGTGLLTMQKNGYDQGAAGAGALGEVVRGVAALPYEQRRGAIAAARPALLNMGMSQHDIDAFDPTDDNLRSVGGIGYSAHDRQSDQQASFNGDTNRIEASNPVVVGGSLVTRGGQELYRAPEYVNTPLGSSLYEVPGTTSQGWSGQPITAEQLYHSAIKPQESGGLPNGGAGAVGQPTKWGRAVGSSQMLPATAQSMAKKLGVDWRPDLMRARSPEGLAYQDKLGIAYAQEALDKTGGDPRAAAMFYHGGPDRAQWGPKTNAYGDAAIGRLDKVYGQRSTSRQPRMIQQGIDTSGDGNGGTTKPGKPIPQGMYKDYDKDIEQYRGLDASVKSFKKDFGGNMAGGLENLAQGFYSGVGTPGQRDWWSAFRSNDNVIRNGLFGSALTEHEKKAYEETTISPGMDPKEIQRNLTRRRDIIRGAVGRRQKFLSAQGYSKEAIIELAGEDIGGIGGAPSSNTGGQPSVGGRRVSTAHAAALIRGQGTDAQFDAVYGAGAAAKVRAKYR